uniref:Uncharacterized protein MANES_05G146900 n=1 Tax=Rhizophora mucronata TaxID=61149 RepID=A0A2P2LEQ3_RHIMU
MKLHLKPVSEGVALDGGDILPSTFHPTMGEV